MKIFRILWIRSAVAGSRAVALGAAAGAAMLAAQLSAAAQTLPVPFKPLPAGTVLDYGTWRCTVENVHGMRYTCHDGEHRQEILGRFVGIGPLPDEDYADSVRDVECLGASVLAISNESIGYYTLPADERVAGLKALWPLRLGSKAKFKLRDSTGDKRLWLTFKVKGVETLVWKGRKRTVVHVYANGDFNCVTNGSGNNWSTASDSVFDNDWWYDPQLGLVLKYRRYWRSTTGHYSYTLQSVTWPHRMNMAAQPPAMREPKSTATPAEPAPNPFAGIDFGKYHALIIGNNTYQHLPSLKTAVNDATAVAKVLKDDYRYDVTLMTNATRGAILRTMAKFRATLKFDDNLLIYYAGHGLLDEVGQQGYWLPVDAEKGIPTNWISTSDLTVMLRAIRAKHVMVVADSCYSGTLVRAAAEAAPRTAREKRAWVERVLKMRTRVALVSGGLEPVEDSGGTNSHSVFAAAFLTALQANRGVLDGQSLFDLIKRPVVLNADQTPEYSDIRKAGDEGGDFLFVRR